MLWLGDGRLARAAPDAATGPRLSSRGVVATFAETGDICLAAEAEVALVDELRTLTAELSPDSSIVLVGYSDQTDPRARPVPIESPCTTTTIPKDVRMHLRVGLFRAALVFELGRRNGLPGFSGEPQVVVGDDLDLNATRTVLQGRRRDGTQPRDRGVELFVVERPPAPAPIEATAPEDPVEGPRGPEPTPRDPAPPPEEPKPQTRGPAPPSHLRWGIEVAAGPTVPARPSTRRELFGVGGKAMLGLRLVDRAIVLGPRMEVSATNTAAPFNGVTTDQLMMRVGAFGTAAVMLPATRQRLGLGAHAGWVFTQRQLERVDVLSPTPERQRSHSPAWGLSLRLDVLPWRRPAPHHGFLAFQATHIPLRVDRSHHHDIQFFVAVGFSHDFTPRRLRADDGVGGRAAAIGMR
ncbi:MAG: hypothetical protein AAF799_27870 [Myxococcota bacterium]